MQVFKDISSIPDDAKRHVIAIGNFDGVHLGHQALIERAQKLAADKGVKMGVLTFEPHPRRLFQPSQPPARLTPFNLKAEQIKSHGVDFLFAADFNWDFASQTPAEFIETVLKENLNAAHIVVGENFCFGQLRKGSAQTIIDAGLKVDVIAPVLDDGSIEGAEVISSSRIRSALRKGDMDLAAELLGWQWMVEGTIFRGDRRGHELGYPTANVLLKETLHPAYGVYACRVQIEGEKEWLPAATNIGIRPMFEVAEGQVEAHILNFPDRDIYDKILRIQPIKRLRGEAKFNSLDELITQMNRDCQNALEILG